MFLGQYVPSVVKLNKEEEFLALKQGNMTFEEYTAKFEELTQFYQLARYAPNDEWKMQRYKRGLRADVAQGLSSYACTNYAALVQQTYVAEEDLKRMY